MGRWQSVGAALALFLLPSCVGMTPTLPSTAKPGVAGYVAAFLSRGRGEGFALRVVESNTGRDYVLEFERGETGARPQMIEVPPGTYRVASWATFNDFRSRLGQQEVGPKHALGRPFTVGAGQVVLLGALDATTTIWREPSIPGSTKFTHYWEVVPKRMTEADAVARFREGFPEFAKAPVTCLLCGAEAEPEPDPQPKRNEFQLTPPTLQRRSSKPRLGG